MSRLFKREPFKEKMMPGIYEPLVGTGQLTPLSDFEKFFQLQNAMKHFSAIFLRCLSALLFFIDICVAVLRYCTIFLKCPVHRKWNLFLLEASELRSFQTLLWFQAISRSIYSTVYMVLLSVFLATVLG